MDLRDAPILLKLALFMYSAGILLYSMGFFTASWYVVTIEGMEYYVGLFEMCIRPPDTPPYGKVCNYLTKHNMQVWHIAGLVLACFGLVHFTSGLILELYALKRDRHALQFAGGAIVAVGGVLGFLGGTAVIDKATNVSFIYVGWSAIVYLTGCSLAFLSTFLLLPGTCQLQRSSVHGEGVRLLNERFSE